MAGYKEIHRVLRAGGALIFSVPMYDTPSTLQTAELKDGKVVFFGEPEYHDSRIGGAKSAPVFWRHSQHDICSRVSQAGFSKTELKDSLHSTLTKNPSAGCLCRQMTVRSEPSNINRAWLQWRFGRKPIDFVGWQGLQLEAKNRPFRRQRAGGGRRLSVFRDALATLAREYGDQYEIVALVTRRELFDVAGVTYLEYPRIMHSYLARVRFEYWSSREISARLKPKLWLSMHDMTPNVSAEVRAVYCHNPSPFYRPTYFGVLPGLEIRAIYAFLPGSSIGSTSTPTIT